MLRDATEQQHSGIPESQGAEWAPALAWIAPVDIATALAAPTGAADIAIPAYANSGRWVVECPDCSSAQFACRTDLRFMCGECANNVVGGLWRPVIWPDEVSDIEAVLSVRPLGNQNWLPEEAVVELVAENVANDLAPVLDDLVAEIPPPPPVEGIPL